MLQVAPGRLARHIEEVGKLRDADRAIRGQATKDFAVAARGKGSGA